MPTSAREPHQRHVASRVPTSCLRVTRSRPADSVRRRRRLAPRSSPRTSRVLDSGRCERDPPGTSPTPPGTRVNKPLASYHRRWRAPWRTRKQRRPGKHSNRIPSEAAGFLQKHPFYTPDRSVFIHQLDTQASTRRRTRFLATSTGNREEKKV